MAKHIVHRYKTEANETFTNEELLLGEIGINVGKGTLTISKKDGESVENVDFINKNTIEGQLNELTTSLNDEIDTFRTDVNSTFNDVNTRVATLETEVETNINQCIETIQQELNTASSNFQNQLSGIDSRVTEISDELNTEGFTKIIASQTPPSQDSIWLDEHDVEVNAGDYQYDIHSMFLAIQELQKTVKRYEELFQTINCGTIAENSSRQEIMDEAIPEAPDGYFDNIDPEMLLELTSENKNIQVTNYYLASESYYGVTIETEGWSESIPSDFDSDKQYLWRYIKITDNNDNLLSQTEPIAFLTYNDLYTLNNLENQYALGDSEEEFPKNKDNNYTPNIPEFNENKPYLWCYIKPIYDEESNKPSYSNFSTGNVKHLVIKSATTPDEIKNNLSDLLNYELVWCEGDNGLYIKSKGNLVKINGGNNFTTDNDNNTENENIMSGIITSGDSIGSITFISTNDKKYTMKINNKGNLQVYDATLDTPQTPPKDGKPGGWVSKIFNQKLYINSLYCGGNDIDENGKEIDEHSLNPCSHNFVELSNMTDEDINLNGLSLQYAENGTNWKVLPLWGVIKKGSTFLIRGAQCSVMNHNTTVIKVADYDMEWFDGDELIKFSNKTAKFYLTYGTDECSVPNPYQDASNGESTKCQYGYIDLVGLKNEDSQNTSGGYEKKEYTKLSSSRLLKKYYAMDNVSQANKELDARDNSKDWYYVDLTRNDILPDITLYTPKSSRQGKNLFYDKTTLKEGKPTVATITFGIQATDGGEGKRATRCFNWVSKGYYDEFLWYRKKGDSSWIPHESFKNLTDSVEKYYNRIQQEASNGDVFTAHKYILRNLKKGEYEYTCGRPNDKGEPNWDACIEQREFTVRSDEDLANGFSFIQVSDQQGFNYDEYQVWKHTADYISKTHSGNTHFFINTGDMTQNGNRLNEWLDYFNGKQSLNNFEEMATIGNNDLCPKTFYELGNGSADSAKINFASIAFFYTFEMDRNNPPIFDDGESAYGYIPSIYSFNYGNAHFMCLNSEISEKTVKNVIGVNKDNSLLYKAIEEWCKKDLEQNSTARWKIAYCHEMPFTIITDSLKTNFFDYSKSNKENQNIERGGSRINVSHSQEQKYWFSKFCQNNGIRLVMGGHKHTQCITWPLKEGEISMRPTIQITENELLNSYNTNELRTINDPNSDLNGCSYPTTWFNGDNCTETDLKIDYLNYYCHFCTFELVESITAPVYSMSQATGYKHTSNKELPASIIPWCRHYYPSDNKTANVGQKHPFYSIYTVKNDEITIDVKRVEEILVLGKFNINEQGEAIKNKVGLNPTAKNGLFANATNEQIIIKNNLKNTQTNV